MQSIGIDIGGSGIRGAVVSGSQLSPIQSRPRLDGTELTPGDDCTSNPTSSDIDSDALHGVLSTLFSVKIGSR